MIDPAKKESNLSNYKIQKGKTISDQVQVSDR